MKLSFGAKIQLLFAGLILLLLILGTASYFSLEKTRSESQTYQESLRILQSSQKLGTDLKGILASYALYALSHERIHAETYRREMAALRENLQDLRSRSTGDPALASRLKEIQGPLERLTASLERGLTHGGSGHWREAARLLEDPDHRRGVQEAQERIQRLTLAQAWALKTHADLEDLNARRNARWIAFGVGFTVLLCLISALLITRQVVARQEAVKQLAANEEKFRSLTEAANDAFLTLDAQGVVVDMNPASEAFFGYPRQELQGNPMRILMPKRFLDSAGEDPFGTFLQMALKPGIRTMELYVRRKDGSEFPTELSVSRWETREGVFYGIISRDITERKFFVKTLLANEHRLFQFLDAVPVGILVRDQAGFHYFANRTAKDLLGAEIRRDRSGPSDLPRQYGLYRAGSHEFYPADRLPLARALAGETSRVDDLELRRGDRTIPLESLGTPILDEKGGVKFALATLSDVTQQKLLTESLREREEFFRSLFEEGPIGMTLSFPDAKFADVNRAFCELSGYSKNELVGRSLLELNHPEDREEENRLLTGLFGRSLPRYQVEKRLLTKDGRAIPCRVTVSVIRDAKGEPLLRLGMVEDITERKHIDDLKRDVIAMVSHQLKTPAAEINGYIENLLDGLAGDLTDRQREYLQDMRGIGQDNYRLISDLLNMSKIERGVLTVDPRPVPLGQLLDLSLRDYEGAIRRKGLDLRVEIAQKQDLVLADPDKTVETLRNLINNAVKCTDKGGIRLSARRENGYSLIEVGDTGIGMGPETLARLFTRERIMGQEAGRAGAGLGLYIAKHFMTLQGGDIHVSSEKGKGTVFTVRIPNAGDRG